MNTWEVTFKLTDDGFISENHKGKPQYYDASKIKAFVERMEVDAGITVHSIAVKDLGDE